MIRVMLVDDHPIVLTGLAAALAAAPDLVVSSKASTLRDARATLQTERPDVVLVDVRLPDGSGLELVAEHSTEAPPAFILLSSFDAPQYVDAALKLGAAGFLLKTASIGDIVSAIRRVHRGESVFNSALLRRAQTSTWARLTDRERTVVRAVIDGQSNGEIAAGMGIRRKTVEAHLTRLFQKCGVGSRTELALMAERGVWLDIPRAAGSLVDRGERQRSVRRSPC